MGQWVNGGRDESKVEKCPGSDKRIRRKNNEQRVDLGGGWTLDKWR